jgi:hypothetical protein
LVKTRDWVLGMVKQMKEEKNCIATIFKSYANIPLETLNTKLHIHGMKCHGSRQKKLKGKITHNCEANSGSNSGYKDYFS